MSIQTVAELNYTSTLVTLPALTIQFLTLEGISGPGSARIVYVCMWQYVALHTDSNKPAVYDTPCYL